MIHYMTSAVAASLLCLLPAAAGENPPADDPLLRQLPAGARKVCRNLFPGHRALRYVERKEKDTLVYRVTFFQPASGAIRTRLVDGETVTELPLDVLELTADGKVLEEGRHSVADSQVPKAVLEAYKKWNAKGLEGMAVFWAAEQKKGEGRTFQVMILVNSLTAFNASFKEDGTVIKAPPIPDPPLPGRDR